MRHHQTQHGLSYLEVMIAIFILGVTAAVVMPSLNPSNSAKLDAAANEIAAAIRFAQSEAIRTKTPYGVNVDLPNDRLRVYRMPASAAVYDVYHPVDKKLYDLQLKTDAIMAGVDLSAASFVFGGFNSSSNLDFSAEGIPKYTSGGRDNMLTSGSITLAYQGQQRIIAVAPMTGQVTIN